MKIDMDGKDTNNMNQDATTPKSASIRDRRVAFEPRFSYLDDEDRYLSHRPAPLFSINVIGTGVNGQEHMRVTEFEGRAKIHGIYDIHPKSAEAAKGMMRKLGREVVRYDSLEAACNDPAVDALIISTPNFTHREILETALASGKHILLEKPMATSVSHAYEILEMSRSYEAVFQIGLQYRYKSIFAETIYETLQRRTIGDVKTISIAEHRIPFLDKVEQWNKFSQYSGGTLVEKCCHYFDLLNLFAGARPSRVIASGSQAVNYKDFCREGQSSDILDNAFVIVEYENGVRGSFNLCMFAPLFYEEVVLCGSEGRIKAAERQDFISNKGLECSMEINLGEERPSRYIAPHYPKHVEEAGHHGATFLEHLRFVDNILGVPTDTATVEEGFWSVVVGAAAEASVREQSVIDVKEFLQAEGARL